jgi:NADPH-dependent 2,4-dienoyl-CoA reductase/sulfur reductase-like enzyme
MGERNAILTDRYQQTSCPDIYAAGDCSTVYHALLEKNIYIPLALSANRQGRMCGENIAAELNGRKPKPFPGIIGTSMTKVFDYEIGKTGIGDMECRQYQLKHVDSVFIKYVAKAGYYPKRSRIWVKLFFEAHSKKIVGAQIVGQDGSVLRLDVIVAAITAGLRLDDLYNMDMGYMPAFSPVWDPLLIAARAGMKEE